MTLSKLQSACLFTMFVPGLSLSCPILKGFCCCCFGGFFGIYQIVLGFPPRQSQLFLDLHTRDFQTTIKKGVVGEARAGARWW